MHTKFVIKNNKLELIYPTKNYTTPKDKRCGVSMVLKDEGKVELISNNNSIDIIKSKVNNTLYNITSSIYKMDRVEAFRYFVKVKGLNLNCFEFNELFNPECTNDRNIFYMQWFEKSEYGKNIWFYKNEEYPHTPWKNGEIVTIIGINPIDESFRLRFTQCKYMDPVTLEECEKIIIIDLDDHADAIELETEYTLEEFYKLVEELKEINNQSWEDFFMKDYINGVYEDDLPMSMTSISDSILIRLDDKNFKFISKNTEFEYKGYTFKFLGEDEFIIDSNTDIKYTHKETLYILCLLMYPNLELDPYAFAFDMDPKQSDEDVFKIEKLEKQFKK